MTKLVEEHTKITNEGACSVTKSQRETPESPLYIIEVFLIYESLL